MTKKLITSKTAKYMGVYGKSATKWSIANNQGYLRHQVKMYGMSFDAVLMPDKTGNNWTLNLTWMGPGQVVMWLINTMKIEADDAYNVIELANKEVLKSLNGFAETFQKVADAFEKAEPQFSLEDYTE